jgi:hypothetical protein
LRDGSPLSQPNIWSSRLLKKSAEKSLVFVRFR